MTSLRAIARRLVHRPRFEQSPSFELAQASASGFNDDRVPRIVASKTQAMRNRLGRVVESRQTAQNLAVLAYVAKDLSRQIDVVDFGGACGATFYQMDHLLPGLIRTWKVVEVKEMIQECDHASASERLEFFESLEDAANIAKPDLVLAHGVLPYTPQPTETLKVILKSFRPAFLYLSRTAAIEEPARAPIFGRQYTRLWDHGPGAIAPVNGVPNDDIIIPAALLPYADYVGALPDSYEIVFEFDEGNQWFLDRIPIRDRGLLARKGH